MSAFFHLNICLKTTRTITKEKNKDNKQTNKTKQTKNANYTQCWFRKFIRENILYKLSCPEL